MKTKFHKRFAYQIYLWFNKDVNYQYPKYLWPNCHQAKDKKYQLISTATTATM